MTEIRLDAGTVSSVRRTPQGGLRVDARLTRVGVLEYRRADGSVRRELRPPDEVFNSQSLDTLRGAPITDLHPSEMVRADTYGSLSRGHVGDDVREDAGRFVAATLYVQDARLVEMVERGDRREISCGYTCDFDETPGEFNGQPYDGVQRNITYNHAALGPRDWGRAGSDVALRMDAADVWTSCAPDDSAQESSMAKRKDAEGDMPSAAEESQAATEGTCPTCGAPCNDDGKYAAPVTDACAADEQKMDSLRGRLDAKEAEIADLRKRLDEANDPKRISALVVDGVAVRRVAERAGVDRIDSLDINALRVAVVEKVTGIRCDGKGHDYVTGLYDAAVKQLERDGVHKARAVTDSAGEPHRVGIIDRMIANANQYQQISNHEKGGR